MSHRESNGVVATVSHAIGSGWARFGRAVYAMVSTVLAQLILVTVGELGLSDITTNQVLVIALSMLGAGGAVYGLTSGSRNS